MDVDETFFSALSSLDCPVSQQPGDSTAATYVTFGEIDGAPIAFASNIPRRVRHLVQVHIFSKDGKAREVQRQVNALLRAAGIRVQQWDFEQYEKDTKYHHLATTCEWVERLEE